MNLSITGSVPEEIIYIKDSTPMPKNCRLQDRAIKLKRANKSVKEIECTIPEIKEMMAYYRFNGLGYGKKFMGLTLVRKPKKKKK